MIAWLNDALRRVPAWPLYPLACLPVVWLYYQGLTGALGVDPVKKIEHQLGLWALWLLIAGLTVTPLMRFAGLRLLKFRRAIGLIAFGYVLVHLLTWLVLDVQFLNVWADITKRPYVTIGMLAFTFMIPLAMTSNDWSLRKLTAQRWRRLHKLTYAVCLLGALHFVMLAKGIQLEPILYMLVVAGLLALRVVPRKRKPLRQPSLASN